MSIRILLNKREYLQALFWAGMLLVASSVFAASKSDIVYPVKELANCKDETSCRSYCAKPDNMRACVAFAEKHNLMSKKEAEKAKKFIDSGSKGPGGCKDQNSCKSYCDDIKNINDCVAYAERTGIMSGDELKEAKKVQNALKKGAKLPGGCRNKEACEEYCESGDNMDECIAFAEAAGFMDPKELEMVKRTGGKGPGGCKGKRACDAYCNNPDHMEECFRFAEQHGLLSDEDREMMEEGKERIREVFEEAPDEVLACIEKSLGSKRYEALKSGRALPTPDLRNVIEPCYRKAMEEENMGKFRDDNDEDMDDMRSHMMDREDAEFQSDGREGLDEFEDDEDMMDDGSEMMGKGMPKNMPRDMPSGMPKAMPGGVRRSPRDMIPEQADDCLRAKYGQTFDKILAEKEFPPAGFEKAVMQCMMQSSSSASPRKASLREYLGAVLGKLLPGSK